jgi:hypothetical protein
MKLLLAALFVLLAADTSVLFAQRSAATTTHSYVVIDSVGPDHGIRRETRIFQLSGPKQNLIRYRVQRMFFPEEHTHFTTGGVMFDPPVILGDLAIYPGRYSRSLGAHTDPDAIDSPEVLLFSEAVESVLNGESLDDILGSPASVRETIIDKVIKLTPKSRMGASLAMTAINISEQEVSRREDLVRYQKWLVDLGNGTKGFVGTEMDSVTPNGPAARAGISAGDLIIALGSHRTDSERKLEIITDYLQPGKQVSCVLVRRNSKVTTVQIVTIVPASSGLR